MGNKILIVTPDLFKLGGVSNYNKVLSKYLQKKADYFAIGSSLEGEGISQIKKIFLDYKRFINLLMTSDYKLIHFQPSLGFKAFFREAVFILIALIFNKSIIIMFHGWDKKFETWVQSYFIWLVRLLYFRAQAIIVSNQDQKNILIKWGYQNNIYLETTVVDDDIFKETDKTILQRLTKKNSFNILFLSRIEKAKGIYEALEAFRILKRQLSDIRLIIAGDGSEKENSMRYVREHAIPDVDFLGSVSGKEKEEVFRKADIFLFPTYHGEGMPTVVLEAMAYGLPVITRPVAGVKDFFEDGKMGYLRESSNSEILANIMFNFFKDPSLRKKIGYYNLLYSQKNFSASKAAERLIKIYGTYVPID